ncbi:hypothetical protein Vadar_014080 [Vaccinium darrowii]|uniref:Uncharacterized protein n=1 Tax=Vaccinium darrowii TaxID=229202 RepID=A0ACB7WYF2_9ERIC|nr:hypothetical protein Vadar_006607 [Vaccinium darrowii]KAH7867556.1 hypothetical protein Vadar_014080 [Vaccinium darrowii]
MSKESTLQVPNSEVIQSVDEFFCYAKNSSKTQTPKFLPPAMSIFNFQILLYSLSMFFCFLFSQTHSLSFNLTNIGPQHQNVNITTFGDAYISSQGIQVTPNERGNLQAKAGKATYFELLHLWDKSTGNLTDFETHFVFVIDSDGSTVFADGLTFFLAPDGASVTNGRAMGLPMDRNRSLPTSPFVAVEFDTYLNGIDVNSRTHVGIDVNSLTSNVTAPWYCNVTGGIPNEAWIRYDSSSHNLSVVFTGSTNTTRVNDTIHLIVDLRDYLPEWVSFGFSAATGTDFEKNNVISWEFSSSLQSNEANKNVTDPVVNDSNRNVTVDPPKKFPIGALVGIVVGSGKASKESDVYSFGVVALEIACGRKPFDLKVPECQMGMVEWVWDLYGMGRLLEAADPKIGPDFDEQEMERLMIVGLWCAHPDHNFRPKIRQAIHVLNFEAPLPILPQKQPALSFFPPPFNNITTSSDTNQNQHSSHSYNTNSSKFTSSSTASSLTPECPKKLDE